MQCNTVIKSLWKDIY